MLMKCTLRLLHKQGNTNMLDRVTPVQQSNWGTLCSDSLCLASFPQCDECLGTRLHLLHQEPSIVDCISKTILLLSIGFPITFTLTKAHPLTFLMLISLSYHHVTAILVIKINLINVCHFVFSKLYNT